MIERARKGWRQFRASGPGHRFRERYRRRQQDESSRWRRPLNIVLGTLIAIVSLFFGWAPGPGTVTFFIGLWMVAGEFRPVARFMDWSEVRVRTLARWAKRFWARSSRGERALIVLGLAAFVFLILYGVYRLLFGG